MIQVYLLEVGKLRRQMEKTACAGESMDTTVLPGWDKLADWQREKISRCAAPGARALCMGGQLLLQYGANEWAARASLMQGELYEGKKFPIISWRIIDFDRLPECIPAPQPLEAAYEPKGKPYILHVPWHYNLSHSGDYVALAISDVPVGVDIQQMRPYKDSLVKRFFSEKEAALYESLLSSDVPKESTPAGESRVSADVLRQNDAKQQVFEDGETLFYTLWCRKEAYGKLLGTGLTEDVLKRNLLEDTGVHLYEYGELPGYRICVCGEKK